MYCLMVYWHSLLFLHLACYLQIMCTICMALCMHVQLQTVLVWCSVVMIDTLPLLLLGIRSSLKEDLCCTATKLVYSTTLRLPGEFFDTTDTHSVPDPQHYVTRLRHSMQLLLPVPTANHSCSKPHCFHFHFILQTAAATLTCSENGTLLCPNDCFIATSLSDCSDSESSSWLSFDSAIQNAIFKYNSHYNARNYHMNNFNLSL